MNNKPIFMNKVILKVSSFYLDDGKKGVVVFQKKRNHRSDDFFHSSRFKEYVLKTFP